MHSELVAGFRNSDVNGWRREITAAISKRGTLHRYERKQVIFHQGMRSSTVYAIKSGLIEIAGLNQSGHELTVSIRGAGEQFGWAEGLLDRPRFRQASVLQDAELWQLDIGEFLNVLAEHPEVMLAALGSAVHRSTSTIRMRSDLRGSSAYDRVSYVLRQLTRSAEDADGASPRHLHITHDEISRVCELSRQTVTTILGEMQRGGILELGLRSIKVIDTAWLADDAELD